MASNNPHTFSGKSTLIYMTFHESSNKIIRIQAPESFRLNSDLSTRGPHILWFLLITLVLLMSIQSWHKHTLLDIWIRPTVYTEYHYVFAKSYLIWGDIHFTLNPIIEAVDFQINIWSVRCSTRSGLHANSNQKIALLNFDIAVQRSTKICLHVMA